MNSRDDEEMPPDDLRWKVNDWTVITNEYGEKRTREEFFGKVVAISEAGLNKELYHRLYNIGYTSLNGEMTDEEKAARTNIQIFGEYGFYVIVNGEQVSEICQVPKPRKQKKKLHKF